MPGCKIYTSTCHLTPGPSNQGRTLGKPCKNLLGEALLTPLGQIAFVLLWESSVVLKHYILLYKKWLRKFRCFSNFTTTSPIEFTHEGLAIAHDNLATNWSLSPNRITSLYSHDGVVSKPCVVRYELRVVRFKLPRTEITNCRWLGPDWTSAVRCGGLENVVASVWIVTYNRRGIKV